MKKETVIVVGAGIVGLAMARSLASRGHAVTVIERNERAVGASIQNFGSLWAVGAANHLYERASVARSIWLDVLPRIGVWHQQTGSLHLAHADDEMQVIEKYADYHRGQRDYKILDGAAVAKISPAAVIKDLRGALYSPDEVLLDSREAIRLIPSYLEEAYGVKFVWRTAISSVETGVVRSGTRSFHADRIYLCGGAEYEWLFPEIFEQSPITRCKLQMLRVSIPHKDFQLGPPLAGGLSLIHYPGFRVSPDVDVLQRRCETEYADLLKLGIHVMAMQHGRGEITIGDSHIYGHTHDPFDEHEINQKILGYMNRFVHLPDTQLVQSWHGIYAKLTDGNTELVREAAPGVTIVNGLGSLGMTLSFGLAEELVGGTYKQPV